jgi:hypothetical protein
VSRKNLALPLAGLVGAILVLPTWAAPRFGIDPRVAFLAVVAVLLTVELTFIILLRVPIRGTAESSTVFPGTPEQLFQISGGVWTTTVVSSDPPRKLVTTITGPGTWRMDREVTYTPVPEGTRSDIRTRVRMPLLYWLLQPVSNRRAKAKAARWDARVKDYLAAGAANTGGVGD